MCEPLHCTSYKTKVVTISFFGSVLPAFTDAIDMGDSIKYYPQIMLKKVVPLLLLIVFHFSMFLQKPPQLLKHPLNYGPEGCEGFSKEYGNK